MGEKIFVSRSTGVLLGVCAALSIVCVALTVALLLPRCPDNQPHQPTEAHLVSEEPQQQPTTPGPTSAAPLLPWQESYRLPRDVLPSHYQLYLRPDLDKDVFWGRADIQIFLSAPRTHLWLHASDKHLYVTRTTLLTSSEEEEQVDVKRSFSDTQKQLWVVEAAQTIPEGNYTLRLEFNGSLSRGIVGFYRSVYRDESTGQQRKIATTKFQPTYARRAFPCFDEPSFKSKFTVTLVRPSEGYIALSNMPIEMETPDRPERGQTEVKFRTSVPMATYLVCFIVCDFQYRMGFTQNGKEFRVYARPQQLDRTFYALNAGINISNYYEDYFEIEYPLPKQDMIAIPDFVSGAMEHWGLITFRETNLLVDDRESSSSNRQRAATVVSHELAHMWFGNLMTLSWWDDLWLNEGFASYIEYKGVAQLEKDWDMESQFLSSDLHYVLELDAQMSSHPIVQSVSNPDEITEIFDTISYNKGSSVLRMLEDFLGSEAFRLGISAFLKKFQYKNAVTQDLWDELQKRTSESTNITAIMDTWTRQMGYPLIRVRKEDTSYILTQKRFLADPGANASGQVSPYGFRWDVTISYTTSKDSKSDTPERVWFYRNETEKRIEIPPAATWIKLNIDQYGYYRVNYDMDNWKALGQLLVFDHERLSPSDRANLLDDAFALANAQEVSFDVPLDLVRYLIKERHYVPWQRAYSNFEVASALLWNSPVYGVLRKYMAELVQDIYSTLGWKDEGGHLQQALRATILFMACKTENENCLKEVEVIFSDWLNNNTYIPPNLRTAVYRFGITRVGTEKEWNHMWERYKNESNAQEQLKLLGGLAWAPQPWILQRFIHLAKDENNVRSQNFFTVLKYISDNPVGKPLVWAFIRDEWPYLVDKFTLNDRTLGRLVLFVVHDFNTKLYLQEMQDFFKKYPDAGAGTRARQQALELVANNIRWVEKNRPAMEGWLKKEGYME